MIMDTIGFIGAIVLLGLVIYFQMKAHLWVMKNAFKLPHPARMKSAATRRCRLRKQKPDTNNSSAIEQMEPTE